MSEQPHTHPTNRLAHLPITLFSMVMGLSGWALAIRASLGALALDHRYAEWIALIASSLMVLLMLAYLSKLIIHPEAVKQELRHPIRIHFFPALSISLLLLSVTWIDYPTQARVLWMLGAVIQLGFTLYVMNAWIHQPWFNIEHANPGWFIPVVGNIIVPIAGQQLGYTEISWFFFSFGLLFWLVLFTVIIYRLIFHAPMALRLTPTLFILLAPPSVGFVSYVGLNGGLDNFARVLYYSALFLGLLLSSNAIRFIKVPFFISSWAYSFPLAALTVASYKMASLSHSEVLMLFAYLLTALLSLLVLWLLLSTLRAAAAKQICTPE